MLDVVKTDRMATLYTTLLLAMSLGHDLCRVVARYFTVTVKLDNKERFDKEQIGIKEPFPVTNLPFTS